MKAIKNTLQNIYLVYEFRQNEGIVGITPTVFASLDGMINALSHDGREMISDEFERIVGMDAVKANMCDRFIVKVQSPKNNETSVFDLMGIKDEPQYYFVAIRPLYE